MLDLRYYQSEAEAAVLDVWGRRQAAVVVACTGSGKTEIYLHLATTLPGRTLVVAHRDYLLDQPIGRLAAHGFDDVAVEKAERRSERFIRKAKVVFASVQSLCRPERLATFDPDSFDRVVIDEGHRAVGATYRRVIDHFRRNARVRFLVLTATPRRKDNVALGNLCGGDVEVAYTYGPKRASDDGWIVPLKFYRREVEGLDFSHVNLRGVDLDPDQVEALLMQEKPLHRVCASLADDRGPTIVFCPGVKVARAYATLMTTRYRPDRATALWADSPDEERELAGRRLAQGELDFIFNVDLFTEGFDVPELSRVVWAAPTASLVRFTQGTGRGFRPHGSLRGRLSGGLSDAPSRRLLIEQSPKPFCEVITYYPQNCKHQLCEPVDILGGDELPPDVQSFARQIQEETARQPGGGDPEADIESARLLVELRALLDRRRKEIKAKAEVNDVEYDAFGGSRNRAVGQSTAAEKAAAKSVSEDWPAGDPASPKQLTWLKHHGLPRAFELGLTKFRAVVVRDLIEGGIAPETALSYGRKQAAAVRDKVRPREGASRA